MKNAIIQQIENKQLKTDIPDFRAGDTVKVSLRIIEGKKERLQIFEGLVLSRQGKGLGAMFTVRKVIDGVGAEKVFPLNSRSIAKIEVVKFGRTRRSKLYYLRDLIGSKVTRIKEDEQKNIAFAQSKAKARKDEAKAREQKAKEAKEAKAAETTEAPKA
jgi:large subunit ribosomal protein L19